VRMGVADGQLLIARLPADRERRERECVCVCEREREREERREGADCDGHALPQRRS